MKANPTNKRHKMLTKFELYFCSYLQKRADMPEDLRWKTARKHRHKSM